MKDETTSKDLRTRTEICRLCCMLMHKKAKSTDLTRISLHLKDAYQTYSPTGIFHKISENGNRGNIGIRVFTTWKQKNNSATRCYPSEY